MDPCRNLNSTCDTAITVAGWTTKISSVLIQAKKRLGIIAKTTVRLEQETCEHRTLGKGGSDGNLDDGYAQK